MFLHFNALRQLGVALGFFLFLPLRGQTPCSASFSTNLTPGGIINLTSTSTGTSAASQYIYQLYGYSPSVGAVANLASSTLSSPVFTAGFNGTYTVYLYLYNNAAPTCSSMATQSVVVNTTATPCNPVAAFSVSSGGQGVFNFTPLCLGTVASTSYSWDFGDNITSTTPSPTHTYTTNGQYTVSLYIDNTGLGTCTAVTAQTRSVCNATPLVASFSSSPYPMGYTYLSSTSTGTVTGMYYQWVVGNGIPPQSGFNLNSISFTSSLNTVFNPTLIISHPAAGCTSSATSSVAVTTAASPCSTSFSYAAGAAGLVNLTSTSTGTTAAQMLNWVIYGSPPPLNLDHQVAQYYTSNPSPVHVFSVNGIYTVNLVIASCFPLATQTINVTNTTTPCDIYANFSHTSIGPGTVSFTPLITGSVVPTAYSWNFGDNASSTAPSPVHTYSADGTYVATLTIVNSASSNCAAVSIKTINVCSYSGLSSSFVYSVLPGGVISLTSTSSGTNANTFHYWSGSPLPAISFPGGGINVTQKTLTVSTNGVYSVHLVLSSNVCSSTSTQTLSVSSVPPPCSVTALFTYTTGNAGNVNFLNTSTGTVQGTSYNWNFGDQTQSGLASPAHSFTSNGIYLVTLTANNNAVASCSAASTQTIQVCSATPMQAAFVYSANAAGVVSFSSVALGVNASTYFQWALNNQQQSGTNVSQVSFTVPTNGIYALSLQVNDPASGCNAALSQSVSVTTLTTPCNLMANFYASATGIPGSYLFNNLSTGTSSNATYTWSFGDNNGSFVLSPVHSYSANGVYTVSLLVNTNFVNTCTASVTKTVAVCVVNPFVASFVYSVEPGGVISFTSTSAGAGASSNFGWMLSNNTAQNGLGLAQTSFTVGQNGIYTASLALNEQGSGCTSLAVQTIVVTSTACIADANFSLYPSGTPQIWNAVPVSANYVTGAQWDWGDGSFSSTLYTSHTYSMAGNYSVCLSLTISCGASATQCQNQFLSRSFQSNDAGIVQINVLDAATVGFEQVPPLAWTCDLLPNPNTGCFKLVLNKTMHEETCILIYNLWGDKVYENTLAPGFIEQTIELSTVVKGLYFVNIGVGAETVVRKVLVTY